MCGWKVDHFVKVGWSLFSRSQQHSHKDSNDEEGKDSSNYSSSYGYRRGLLKWNILAPAQKSVLSASSANQRASNGPESKTEGPR